MTDSTYVAAECTSHPPPRRCFGPELNANMAAWFPKFRSYKLLADASLFIAPHTAMGVALELLLAFVLLGWTTPAKCSAAFFPLTIVFAVHMIPVADGMPSRLASAPVNTVLIGLLLLFAALGHVGMLLRRLNILVPCADGIIRLSFMAIGVLANTALVGEWGLLGKGAATRDDSGAWIAPEGDLPHPQSGHDLYARMECPALGWFFTLALMFGLPYYLIAVAVPEAPTQLHKILVDLGVAAPEPCVHLMQTRAFQHAGRPPTPHHTHTHTLLWHLVTDKFLTLRVSTWMAMAR